MTFKEFIENCVKVTPGGKHIKLRPSQCAFIDWVEKCRKKGLKPFYLKGRGRL